MIFDLWLVWFAQEKPPQFSRNFMGPLWALFCEKVLILWNADRVEMNASSLKYSKKLNLI